jgi:hypothetical protein
MLLKSNSIVRLLLSTPNDDLTHVHHRVSFCNSQALSALKLIPTTTQNNNNETTTTTPTTTTTTATTATTCELQAPALDQLLEDWSAEPLELLGFV